MDTIPKRICYTIKVTVAVMDTLCILLIFFAVQGSQWIAMKSCASAQGLVRSEGVHCKKQAI